MEEHASNSLLSNAVQKQITSSLENLYETSKCYVNIGLAADEKGDKSMAIKHYVDALQCLEKGSDVNLSGLSGDYLSHAQIKQYQMQPILQQVRSRLYELQEDAIATRGAPFISGMPLPAYSSDSNAVPTAPSATELNNGQINSATAETRASSATADDALTVNNSTNKSASQQSVLIEMGYDNAVELLNIPRGVQLFSVEEGLEVNAAPPSYPTSLSIYKFDDDDVSSTKPPGFIHVGDWVYPLIPNQSPVLRCANGAFIFPNLTTESSSSHSMNIGLVLSSDLDPCYEEMLVNLLTTMASLRQQNERPEGKPDINLRKAVVDRSRDEVAESETATSSTSAKIASGIETGTSWVTWGLSKGAELTADLIRKGAGHLKRNITPNETPSQVNPKVEKGLYYTHQVTKATVRVSGEIVRGLCAITSEIAQGLKPHLQSILPSSSTEQDSTVTDGAILIASTSLHSFSAIWSSMEEAGMAIARSVSKATVDTVQYKYGKDAGTSTSHVMGAAVNCGKTAFNLNNLGVKAIAKRTAKDTGKAVLEDYDHLTKKRDKTTSGVEKKPSVESFKSTSSKKLSKK